MARLMAGLFLFLSISYLKSNYIVNNQVIIAFHTNIRVIKVPKKALFIQQFICITFGPVNHPELAFPLIISQFFPNP